MGVKMDRACKICSGSLSHRDRRAMYCSVSCKEKARTKANSAANLAARAARSCSVCGVSLAHKRSTRAVTCSPACATKATVVKRIAARREVRASRPPCVRCGETIPDDRQNATAFCSVKCKKAVRHQNKGRDYMREYLYGLTPDDYAEMISQQDHRCAICGTMDWGGKSGEPHVDHDHTTGEVRGLLCASCNYGLGCFKDEAKTLRVAADYLDDRRRYQACGGTE